MTKPEADMLRYAELQYAYVQFLSEHLADCRKVFGGDLDAVLVLAVIGQHHLGGFLAQPGTIAHESLSISASRLSDVTGVPRETVRRKLLALERKGWIRQVEDGSWSLVIEGRQAAARNDLADLDTRGMSRLLRLNTDVVRILTKHDRT